MKAVSHTEHQFCVEGSIEAFFDNPRILESMRERAKAMRLEQIEELVEEQGGWLTNGNARMLIAEMKRLQDVIDSGSPLYYIQTSDCVGNEALWWKPAGYGYTTHLSEAGKYTADEANAIYENRNSDLPWLCTEVEALAHWTVDVGKLTALRT